MAGSDETNLMRLMNATFKSLVVLEDNIKVIPNTKEIKTDTASLSVNLRKLLVCTQAYIKSQVDGRKPGPSKEL